MPKAQETTLELDLTALAHNYQYLKSKLQEQTRFLAVVKAFAYGSDACAVAQKLQELNADYFAVAYTNEGVSLRDGGITKPILVLHPLPVSFEAIIDRCLEPNLYSFKVLKAFIETAETRQQTHYPIHLKFNTGLNRLGFKPSDVPEICELLAQTNAVQVKSAFSHLVASEDLNERTFSLEQIARFKALSEKLKGHLGYDFIKHMCNTSGILNYPEAHFDMVRSGIGLYGFGNSKKESKHLKPVARLKSVISQIHTLQAGESLGYNRGFKAERITKSATIPIGHADGIGRQYGKGKGFVFINGKPAPILGNVCMDMIMVDVTNINCEEGDEVIVFDGTHSAETLAEHAGTISYEIITSISQRVKRIVLDC